MLICANCRHFYTINCRLHFHYYLITVFCWWHMCILVKLGQAEFAYTGHYLNRHIYSDRPKILCTAIIFKTHIVHNEYISCKSQCKLLLIFVFNIFLSNKLINVYFMVLLRIYGAFIVKPISSSCTMYMRC